MDARISLRKRHPWLFALGVLSVFACLAFVSVVALFFIAIGSGHWG
ncbi:MAG: hypothetical protein ABR548_08325 [Actinomycetota bacterium]|nr:hypothetical protein [Actinomycetota bacterium]